MSKSGKGLSRRTFVKIGVVAGGGLTLGVSYRVITGPGDPLTDAAFAPNAFLRIDTDGSITVMVGRSEMGQGVATALPQLLAEELGVPWDRVSFEFAPAHPAYGMFGMQVTGGSTSVIQSWEPLREAGAKARWMLREAAAQQWGVQADQVRMYGGKALNADGSELTYGELAAAAALLDVPKDVPLKDPADFRLIGESVPRLDRSGKGRRARPYSASTPVPRTHASPSWPAARSSGAQCARSTRLRRSPWSAWRKSWSSRVALRSWRPARPDTSLQRPGGMH